MGEASSMPVVDENMFEGSVRIGFMEIIVDEEEESGAEQTLE